jgi:hypothetical protein
MVYDWVRGWEVHVLWACCRALRAALTVPPTPPCRTSPPLELRLLRPPTAVLPLAQLGAAAGRAAAARCVWRSRRCRLLGGPRRRAGAGGRWRRQKSRAGCGWRGTPPLTCPAGGEIPAASCWCSLALVIAALCCRIGCPLYQGPAGILVAGRGRNTRGTRSTAAGSPLCSLCLPTCCGTALPLTPDECLAALPPPALPVAAGKCRSRPLSTPSRTCASAARVRERLGAGAMALAIVMLPRDSAAPVQGDDAPS